ncbi:F-box protein At3g07870-like [Papaver somniferum]|uniref:F-box protein At3g07870-like n=1 Tax=Papaver somniferum TaxID=3469 RepID=UPI000E6FF5F2|nr:F-box protein At3g07870-like [Papaver somniferum]
MHRLNHADDDSGTLCFLACTSDENYIPKFHYFEYNENHDESTTPVQRIKRVNLVTTSGEIRFEGSSNRLICLDDGLDDEYIYICNPITREYVMLPKPKKDTYVGGFGHVSSTGEYKVVGIHIHRSKFHKSGFAQVYVYTLGSGKGWRNLGKFKSEFDILSSWDTAGIVANGAIYWQDIDSEIILTFDLAEEKFSENLSEPPLPQDIGWLNHGIGVLNGFLFVVMGLKGEEDGLNDVWLLKNKIDNHGMEVGDERHSLGWSKEFRVDGANLLAFTKSGGVLDSDNRHLNIYDTKTSTKKLL